MAYIISNINDDKVEFVMTTGKDLVKNTMSKADAEALIENGKTEIVNPTVDGFNLLVDKKYYFKVSEDKKKTPKAKSEE